MTMPRAAPQRCRATIRSGKCRIAAHFREERPRDISLLLLTPHVAPTTRQSPLYSGHKWLKSTKCRPDLVVKKSGRSERIRTSDPLYPKQVRRAGRHKHKLMHSIALVCIEVVGAIPLIHVPTMDPKRAVRCVEPTRSESGKQRLSRGLRYLCRTGFGRSAPDLLHQSNTKPRQLSSQ